MELQIIYKTVLGAVLGAALASCNMAEKPLPVAIEQTVRQTPMPPGVGRPEYKPVTSTLVESPVALERLKNSRGMTLQWISWDYLGPVAVADNDGVIRIAGSQEQRGGPGKVTIAGDVVRINESGFTFRGIITITDTPDNGRNCVLDSATSGDQPFGITQNRKYWRLREFQWCDGLTDYIDIYFAKESGS